MNINFETENVTTKLDFPDVPEDIIFPDELNRYLREQIRYYMHENGMLQKNLLETESHYDICKTKMNVMEQKLKNYEKSLDCNDIQTSKQVAGVKIVELSKKLREKNAEVETLKTKNSKLEQHILELRQADNKKETSEEHEEKPFNELEENLRKLQEKLNFANNRLSETRNLNLQLKNDLKLANKWLQQEIGENFDSLNAFNGNWRGRAQIICDLQQKNNELKNKVKIIQEKLINSSALEAVIPQTRTDSKISMLSKENNDLKLNYDNIKKKYDALRARCKVLDTEYALLKSKFTVIKDQSERYQDLISTLSAQISNTCEEKNDDLRLKGETINKILKEKEILYKQIDEYKAVINELKEKLQEENEDVENLRNERPQALNNCEIHQETKHLNYWETERTKLLELIEIQNNRLKEEREVHSKTQSLLRYEKQRAAKAAANAARIELESSTSRSSCYSTVSSSVKSVDFNLKNQLELAEENIKALKTRLELEELERKNDFQEFSKILQNYESKK